MMLPHFPRPQSDIFNNSLIILIYNDLLQRKAANLNILDPGTNKLTAEAENGFD